MKFQIFVSFYIYNFCAADDKISSHTCYTTKVSAYYEFSPLVNSSWEPMPQDKSMWSARNGHATCVFKGKIFLVGGRSDSAPTYNLQNSVLNADVWHSTDGGQWTQITDLTGDYFAQNDDAKQPGPTAPWYGRYGHTLTRFVWSGGEVMILTGGFAPDAMNDVWVVEQSDGGEWLFVHYAPWSPRAYHSAVVFGDALYVLGGTPLTNDMWRLKSIRRVQREPPLTRAMFSNHTYEIEWERLELPPWSPRAGMGVVSHWGLSHTPRRESLLLVGGYGGWPKGSGRFDGFRCRADVWEYYKIGSADTDKFVWRKLTDEGAFGGRAWFGLLSWTGPTPRDDVTAQARAKGLPPRVWMVGGGYLGSDSHLPGSRQVMLVEGRSDVFWTRDGVNWTRANKQFGGPNQQRPLWSSSDWSCFKITDKSHVFRGVWGHTLVTYNSTSGRSDAGDLIMIGGASDTASGSVLNRVWVANHHLQCFRHGIECSGIGKCIEGKGCVSADCTGDDYCYDDTPATTTGGAQSTATMSTLCWFLVFSATTSLFLRSISVD